MGYMVQTTAPVESRLPSSKGCKFGVVILASTSLSLSLLFDPGLTHSLSLPRIVNARDENWMRGRKVRREETSKADDGTEKRRD